MLPNEDGTSQLTDKILVRAPRWWLIPEPHQSGSGKPGEVRKVVVGCGAEPQTHTPPEQAEFLFLALIWAADSSVIQAVVRPALRGVGGQQRNPSRMQLEPFLLTSTISPMWSQRALHLTGLVAVAEEEGRMRAGS